MINYLVTVLLFPNFFNVTIGEKIASLSKKNEEIHLHCESGSLLSSYVCIPRGYIKGEAPKSPTIVNTKIEINNIREVNDKKMRITIDFYQELSWRDNRITTILPSNGSSVLNNNLINRIWKPDLWIKNLFDFKLRGVLEPTGGFTIKDQTFNEERNTLINYNMEAQATIYCNFNFLKYPMDTQFCEFIIDAAYPQTNVVRVIFELGLFGVTNNNFNLDDFAINVTFKNETGQTGIYSIIKLERQVLPFIIRYYLPCIAIITVSLMNFLISVDSIPARTALLVTQFLTLTNILIAQQGESPSSGKFTALNVYLLASLIFVVADFVEFAVALHLHQFNEKKKRSRQKYSNKKKASIKNSGTKEDENSSICITKPFINIRGIDRISFVVAMILFLIFNITYWIVYMNF